MLSYGDLCDYNYDIFYVLLSIKLKGIQALQRGMLNEGGSYKNAYKTIYNYIQYVFEYRSSTLATTMCKLYILIRLLNIHLCLYLFFVNPLSFFVSCLCAKLDLRFKQLNICTRIQYMSVYVLYVYIICITRLKFLLHIWYCICYNDLFGILSLQASFLCAFSFLSLSFLCDELSIN